MAAHVLPLRRGARVLSLFVCFSLIFSLVVARVAWAQQMVASWYGPGFQGAKTASGEPFNMYDYTAASPYLPFGTKLKVCYDGCVVVTVNDRGPYVAGRQLDLSYAAARAIGLTAVGVASVDVQEMPASTPTGPYPSGGGSGSTGAQPQTSALTPSAASSSSSTSSATSPSSSASSGASAPPQPSAAASQYANAAQDQYANAAQDQYGGQPPQAPPSSPAPEAVVPPPPPAPSQLEVPPPQLVKPDSTAQRAIEMGLAKAPQGYTGPVKHSSAASTSDLQSVRSSVATVYSSTPASSPQSSQPADTGTQTSRSSGAGSAVGEKQKGAGGITVLPDTGGGQPWALVAGAALLCLGTVGVRRIFRR